MIVHHGSMGLLAVGGTNGALVTFVVYMLGVFGIAWAANRLMKGKEFLSEYFLGSRSLGTWAFALTFAATSASGGTFTGFPAKIYTHGWILALWIASYMVVPICTMGLFGKRVNQVARKSGAITVPDILRDRYNSPVFGLVATLLIVFFMAFNLVAQFVAGSKILKTLVADVPAYRFAVTQLNHLAEGHQGDWWMTLLFGTSASPDWGYLLCLVIFGATVVFYTTYGGFHAVVWTDVMQGFVMVVGVLIMLPLALSQVGGLQQATTEMAAMTPPRPCRILLEVRDGPPGSLLIPKGTPVRSLPIAERSATGMPAGANDYRPLDPLQPPRLFRVTEAIAKPEPQYPLVVSAQALEITTTSEVERFLQKHSHELLHGAVLAVGEVGEYAYGANAEQRGAYVRGPGPSAASANGFLPLGAAISFFFMWAISGTGQPQYMVRLMAFNNSRTLRQAIITVTLYFGLIYFPLVIIFCCARVLVPGLEYDADSVMPRMAVHLTASAGHAWLAGLLIAAPFAAVMSTVDSFLLVVSSTLVRDIWQRNIDPHASQRFVKRLSYLTTLGVGAVALVGAVNPPQFLQDIVVYTGSGLAACFLFPVAAALYWPRSTTAGCLAGMLTGFGVHLAMHVIGMLQPGGEFVRPYELYGFTPVVVALAPSMVATVAVSLLTPPPEESMVRKYFSRSP